ncbi:MAG: hypothetical protein AB7I04_06035 [Pseudomonadales bacterium]
MRTSGAESLSVKGLAAVLLLAAAPVAAEVTAVAADGFVSEHTLTLRAETSRAYRALTDEVGAWWDASHSYSGEAANFSLDARAGGCFCEALPDGGSVEHMHVVFAQPGRQLRMQGGLGPLQGMGISGSMTFELAPGEDGQTVLRYRYVVSGASISSLAALAEPVDQVQLGQLRRLAAYLAGEP